MLLRHIILQLIHIRKVLLKYLDNLTSKPLIKPIIIGHKHTSITNVADQPISMTVKLILIPRQHNQLSIEMLLNCFSSLSHRVRILNEHLLHHNKLIIAPNHISAIDNQRS